MQHISTLFQIEKPKSRETERGELMRYFINDINMCRDRDNQRNIKRAEITKTKIKLLEKINYTWVGVQLKRAGVPKGDAGLHILYKLKSYMRQSRNPSWEFYDKLHNVEGRKLIGLKDL